MTLQNLGRTRRVHYTNQRAAEPAADEGVPERAAAVVDAMRHAWGGYVEYAWGTDELQPVSKTGTKTYGGLAATIIDSMSTLHLMGLHNEFARCASLYHTALHPRRACTAPTAAASPCRSARPPAVLQRARLGGRPRPI